MVSTEVGIHFDLDTYMGELEKRKLIPEDSRDAFRSGYAHWRRMVRNLGASNTDINPLWIQRLAAVFDNVTGEASVLVEQCARGEVRAFRSDCLDRLPDLQDGESFVVPPLSDVLLLPSCPLLFISRTRNECFVALAYLWQQDRAYLVLAANTGNMLHDFDAVLRGSRGVHLELGVSEVTGRTLDFIKWLCGTTLSAKDRVLPTPGQRYCARKEKRRPPSPYYIVSPHDAVTRTKAEIAARGGLEFRHLRRAHLRLLLERSTEPLQPREGWQLLGPDDEAGPKLAAHLQARGHPAKQRDEWFLVRVCVVDQTIVGPEDKPYIPSVKETGVSDG